jgi:hypothetical protein
MRHCSVLFVLLMATLCVPALSSAVPPDDAAGRVDVATTEAATSGLRLPSGDRLLQMADDPHDDAANAIVPQMQRRDPRRAVLSSLDVLAAVVQGYDGVLTLQVVRAGGVESNPLLKPVASQQGAMMAVKVAAAISTVVGTEVLWRNDHRIGAIVASVLANSAMLMVARHNAQVLAQMQGR